MTILLADRDTQIRSCQAGFHFGDHDCVPFFAMELVAGLLGTWHLPTNQERGVFRQFLCRVE